MRLWKIERLDWDYDEHGSAVIRAETEADVRRIAAKNLYPVSVWSDADVTVTPIEQDGDPGIVVESFHAG